MRPWLCSNDHPREAGGTSVTHIANAHRTTIARPTKLPTFLLYSTVPVAQSAAVSLNLGEVTIYWSLEDEAFIAEVPELAGCAADGESYRKLSTTYK